ncbi:hypothetical protein QQ020_28840 [Fulvivirgaceae bacterium BMA12]|uniref:VOC domain-containing protein n=1 Tax=Agaribacillus aureus TaxID=3051825 RepID=A0ABT8LEB4_9BACT|nr:hypothetical protein [Fulvivirgaceae bacterium BMA12]
MNTIIHTPTNRLDDSVDFYLKLNFKVISDDQTTLVSDGRVIIEINPDRFARAGVKLFDTSWKQVVDKLRKITTVIDIDHGYLLSDPSGVWVYLMEAPINNNYDLSSTTPSVLGNFAGLSLETIPMNTSFQVWQILGFSKKMGSVEQGWVSLANADEMTVSLMKPLSCPHLFFNPSLTYFNGENNLAIIEKIRALNIPIAEEITYFNNSGIVDNIIIRDPGGFGYFIFND